ncbi:MAG: sugar transferase [Deltaproteobacteria bacterium]|nr:sugar transferase [Deltaproteobacteria bacterium]
MNLLKNINPFSRSQGNDRGAPLLSPEEFRAVLRHECARCDRNSHEFSLVTLDTAGQGTRRTNHLIREIIRVMRATDEIGWLGICRMGIFLPETSVEGAWAFVGKLPDGISIRVYSYPSNFPFEEGKRNGKDDGSKDGRRASRPDIGSSSPPTTPYESDLKTYIHHSEDVNGIASLIYPKRLPVSKRAIDIAGSLLGLTILSPLFLAVGAFIKLVSPGPVFFKQNRVGYLGSPFTMWKFRTMKVNADASVHEKHLNHLINSDETLTKLDLGKDNRLIPLAGLIRKTCVDELPQLINVLLGDMSLVGPRPCISYEARGFQRWQHRRFNAFPGMTGLWQVCGKNRTTFKEMMRLDIRYSEERSLWSDTWILVRTFPAILTQIADSVAGRRKAAGTSAPQRVRSLSFSNFVRQLFL